jgi:hypothetical protein
MQRKPGTARGSPRRSRTAKAPHISRWAVKLRCACGREHPRRFPGGGAIVRFVHEAGWSNAMRYMLTGDHWDVEAASRMGIVQKVVLRPSTAPSTPQKTSRTGGGRKWKVEHPSITAGEWARA